MKDHHTLPSEPHQSEHQLRLSTIMVSIMLVIQVAGGIWTNSLAIASDAWHLFSDLLALLLSWYAVRQTLKAADEKHTYGYHRFGSLAALINGLSLIGISIFISYQAVMRLIHPADIHSQGMMIFAAIGFVGTFMIVMVLRQGEQNINVKSALLHFLGDVLSYLGILIGGVVIHYTGWIAIDPILSAVFALIILRNAWEVTKEAGLILLEAVPENISVNAISQRLMMEPQIRKVTDLHVWSLSNEHISLSAHVLTYNMSGEETTMLIRRLEQILFDEFGIAHTTLQCAVETTLADRYRDVAIPHVH